MGWRIVAAVVLAVLTGCGGGGGGGLADVFSASPDSSSQPDIPDPAPVVPRVELGTPLSQQGLSVFYQHIPLVEAFDNYASVGSPNAYILARSFAAVGGGAYQLGFRSGAFDLSVGQGTMTEAFPYDQTHAELTYYSPEEGIPEGGALLARALVRSPEMAAGTSWASFANTSTIAWLTSSRDSRLQQQVLLPDRPAGPLVLTWETLFNGTRAQYGFLDAAEPNYFRVVLRDLSGEIVETLFEERQGIVLSGVDGTAVVPARHAGQLLVLSFEARTNNTAMDDYYGPGIDNVSLKNGADELILDGDFEAAAPRWKVNLPDASQNVTSGKRTVAGLDVRRSVYVPVTGKWGRWTDVFTNPTSQTVTTVVTYTNEVGYGGQAIIRAPAGAPAQALSLWDARSPGLWRDVGLVFGNASQVEYQGATAVNAGDGEPLVKWVYPVTIPPRGSVSIVQFLILTTHATWQTATDASARAVEAEAVATDIVNNFRTDVKFRKGMTQQQLDTILNF
ncbi:MAG: hypothetical protein ABW051_08905 [Burkholderiaceae bacterium]